MLRLSRVVTEEDEKSTNEWDESVLLSTCNMNASEDATNLSNMLHGPHSCVPLVLRLAKRQSRAASGRSTSHRVALATKGTQESRARAIRQSLATIRLRPCPTKNICEIRVIRVQKSNWLASCYQRDAVKVASLKIQTKIINKIIQLLGS